MKTRERLLLNTSMLLYKFSEGEEAWTEWVDVADTLEDTLKEDRRRLAPFIRETVQRRVDEFRQRQAHAESQRRVADADTGWEF